MERTGYMTTTWRLDIGGAFSVSLGSTGNGLTGLLIRDDKNLSDERVDEKDIPIPKEIPPFKGNL